MATFYQEFFKVNVSFERKFTFLLRVFKRIMCSMSLTRNEQAPTLHKGRPAQNFQKNNLTDPVAVSFSSEFEQNE